MSEHGPRRTWRVKFHEAGRGVVLAMRGQSSFAVHSFAAVAVVIAAALLGCDYLEWCLLVLCIGGVWSLEIVNAAIETLFHALDAGTKSRMVGCLDRAAGAVLVMAATSVVVGVLVLGRRFALAMGWLT